LHLLYNKGEVEFMNYKDFLKAKRHVLKDNKKQAIIRIDNGSITVYRGQAPALKFVQVNKKSYNQAKRLAEKYMRGDK
ncbi:MAG: hypothetical protein ACOCP4_07720, partial [Candidatus Woesearchaeota archaeon]